MSLFFILLKVFENEILPIICFVEFPSEAIMSWIFDCSMYFVFKLQILFHFQWSVHSNCFLLTQFMQTVFLDTCPFLLGYVICWHIVHSIFLWFFFCISAVLLLILFIWVFSFLCVNLGRGLLILFILSSNQLIDSLIFYCLFVFFF